ncbi:MAG: tRNA glutamyl-Q(34) synthetase GluQRS, partial [Betaproteobacteria bacterium]|nr:tRNA glutamyl-Q(34) synthetase GluQRS [Betaproteobacteria bacterium]
MTYRGRFAPTPSGPLHFGSLVAATGSYLEAKRHAGEWWLRIDDIDPPRVQPGAADAILHCLERYGFQWDGPVIHQSRRRAAYHAALHRLRQLGLVYACACTRKEIARIARSSAEGPIYPGTCRTGCAARGRALRLDTRGPAIEFLDELQGPQRRDIEHDLGDFVLYRGGAVYSFQLAAAVDDGDYAMTHIVRGADLLESSARQIYLQKLLGYAMPSYMHL